MKNNNIRTLLASLYTITLAVTTLAQGPPATLVVTEKLKKMQFHDQVTLVGRTEANAHSKVVAAVSGRVKIINSNEGRRVQKGDALVSIDTEKIVPLADARRAEAAEAKAKADVAQKDLERAEKLFSEKTISQSRIEQIRAETTGATENYNRLKAEAEALEVDLKNCVIRAPFDGYTVDKLVDVGEWVTPGAPVFEMVDLSSIRVTVDLPERYYGQVITGSEVRLTISGDETRTFSGVVSGVAPSATSETHTFPVIVTTTNKDHRLGSGMLVKAIVSLNKAFAGLAAPKDALVRQGNATMIYTVVEGKASLMPVTVGSVSDQMIELRGAGLVEGMPVVVRGNERIYPGAPVREEEKTDTKKADAKQTEKSTSRTTKPAAKSSGKKGGTP